ncbi:MAG: right-handed parallel beta-helix repeat-containing protein [Armatimonadetes bacterium]|nr:right-handed parallel beta-helix repeat-containing protein [Armatimonadota bacterium]
MRKVRDIAAVLFALVLALTGQVSLSQEARSVSTAEELQALFARPLDSVEIRLLPGTYELTPTKTTDPVCGNCSNSNTTVNITLGLRVTGKNVRISGPEDRTATIVTHAGYGIYFDDCKDCGIHDNMGVPAIIAKNTVGIMGICGLTGARLTILRNEVIRNSWDGIALYRGAEAVISGNIVDGVDKATGRNAGGGRGVGIGVTWDAKALIEGNLVKRYWKGIGLFVNADGAVRRNIVEEILTWGITLWDAGKGAPRGNIEENVIYDTGTCGAAITRTNPGENPGRFIGNILLQTCRNPKYDTSLVYCYQCALAQHAVPEGFIIEGNLFYDNRRGSKSLPDYDMPKEKFLEGIRPLCRILEGYSNLRGSKFLSKYGYHPEPIFKSWR